MPNASSMVFFAAENLPYYTSSTRRACSPLHSPPEACMILWGADTWRQRGPSEKPRELPNNPMDRKDDI